jgi:hypothetical protein
MPTEILYENLITQYRLAWYHLALRTATKSPTYAYRNPLRPQEFGMPMEILCLSTFPIYGVFENPLAYRDSPCQSVLPIILRCTYKILYPPAISYAYKNSLY